MGTSCIFYLHVPISVNMLVLLETWLEDTKLDVFVGGRSYYLDEEETSADIWSYDSNETCWCYCLVNFDLINRYMIVRDGCRWRQISDNASIQKYKSDMLEYLNCLMSEVSGKSHDELQPAIVMMDTEPPVWENKEKQQISPIITEVDETEDKQQISPIITEVDETEEKQQISPIITEVDEPEEISPIITKFDDSHVTMMKELESLKDRISAIEKSMANK